MSEPTESDLGQQTKLGGTPVNKAVIFGVLALVGLVVGFVLPFIAGAIEDSVGDPWDEPLELIAELPHWITALVLAVVGIVAGLLLARRLVAAALTITISDAEVTFERNGRSRQVPREHVHAVLLDGQDLVLRDAEAGDLVRERNDLISTESARIPEAFQAHGYPWS